MIGETSCGVFPAASPAAFQGCSSKALPSCCSRKQAGLSLYLSRTGRGEGRWELGTGGHFCRFAGGNRGSGRGYASLDPANLSQSAESGVELLGIRSVSDPRVQGGRGQRGAAASPLLLSRHQDHPQNHAVLPPRCPSPAAPGLWSPSALPVPDRALGPGLGRHPYLSAQSQRRRLGRSPALPGRV